MSTASQPYTSDASLNAARVLDGQMKANTTQIEGALKDDAEI